MVGPENMDISPGTEGSSDVVEQLPVGRSSAPESSDKMSDLLMESGLEETPHSDDDSRFARKRCTI